MRALLSLVILILSALGGWAAPLSHDELAALIIPPFSLGASVNDRGVWQLLNSGGAEAGYVFETEPLAPLPGFSGAPINMLVTLDLDGRFLDVQLISQNEPIFVSGLGEAPLRRFLEQYRGHSIFAPLVVGNPYGGAGAGSDLVYLDGVTKATASVLIAHQSILAAALAVTREKMAGVATHPPAYPNPSHDEALNWNDLVAQGLASRLRVTNRDLDAGFAGTLWKDDDPLAKADPDGLFLDVWVVDLGPPAVARAVLDDDGFAGLQRFVTVSGSEEPILVIDAGRHGLVSEDFVRNTAPDRLSGTQSGLPLSIRDADLDFALRPQVPQGTAMILRLDRRLGFDPTQDWTLSLQAVRAHGSFQPEFGSAHFSLTTRSDPRFFLRPGLVATRPAWQEAILNRGPDLVVLAVFLGGLLAVLGLRLNRLAGLAAFTPVRLAVLGFVVLFVGFWGQGQLSIVTVLGALRTALTGGGFAYLLYDPFSLLIWGVSALGLFLWGRGLFCGWLCPFGALQEFAHHVGRLLRLPQYEPSVPWDRRLKAVKYLLLAGMVATVVVVPAQIEAVAEVEPFKTAITVHFLRSWPYAAYALAWLGLGMVTFKGFCRYVCPLGAVMAIGGLIRGRDWIARRAECGSPCQLCKVRCKYGAIRPNGTVDYSECFQCLDCVTIHDDAKTCVPLVLAARSRRMEVQP
jgi:NosR/NirI family nitrous oxide reductase transcriptional regulator